MQFMLMIGYQRYLLEASGDELDIFLHLASRMKSVDEQYQDRTTFYTDTTSPSFPNPIGDAQLMYPPKQHFPTMEAFERSKVKLVDIVVEEAPLPGRSTDPDIPF